MSGPCPVVRVVWDNPDGFCEINESDFNPEVHTLFNKAIEAQADGAMSPSITGDGSGVALPEIDPEGAKKATVAELKEALTAKGIEIPEGAKKATVAELKEALTAKGIEIPEGAKKAELQVLLDKSE